MENHTLIYVDKLPCCEFCPLPARYDGKIRGFSSWGYMCEYHFIYKGIGLGLGKGQQLRVKE